MSDLRTYQLLTYLTNQPHMAQELLGVRPHRRASGHGLTGRLLAVVGRGLAACGQWLVSRYGMTDDQPGMLDTTTKQTA